MIVLLHFFQAEHLQEYREERIKEWKEFQNEIAKEHDQVEDSFRTKKVDLEKFFQNAEMSLKQ